MHDTLWNAIFKSLIGYEIDIIDTPRFNNDTDFLYRLATTLKIRPNHEYWCKCTWQTSGINKESQQNSHKWQTWPPLTVGLPVTSQRYWASFTKSLDCFTMRLFHSATIFCCYICTCICCLKLHQADYQVGEVFFFLTQFGGGALSSNVFTICAVYWNLGRRGYFGVSNVVLVCCCNISTHNRLLYKSMKSTTVAIIHQLVFLELPT